MAQEGVAGVERLHVEHGAAALGGDGAQAGVEHVARRAAVATAKDVGEHVGAVHAHEGGRDAVEAAEGQGKVVTPVEPAAKNVGGELAVGGDEGMLGDFLDEFVLLQPVGDELLDGDHLEPEALPELHQLGQALHRAVVIDQFADDAAGLEPGQHGEIYSRLGVAGALQHAARAGAQREHVAGLHQLVGAGIGIGEYLDRDGAIIGADAGRDALGGVHRDGEIGALDLAVARHHRSEAEAVELMAEHGHAHDAAAVTDHEVDHLRRGLGGRHDEVALVFAVLVVRHDDGLAGGDGRKGVFHGIKGLGGVGTHGARKEGKGPQGAHAACGGKVLAERVFSGDGPGRFIAKAVN